MSLLEDAAHEKCSIILVILDYEENDGQEYPPNQAPNDIWRAPLFGHTAPLQSKDVTDESCEQDDSTREVHL